jgi:hypothetical protein
MMMANYLQMAKQQQVLTLRRFNRPTISTTHKSGSDLATVETASSQPLQVLVDWRPAPLNQTLTLEYGPRGSERRTFSGILRADGIEVDGEVFSVSYAALHCMKLAGSKRRTANGWTMWRVPSGEFLSQVYESAKASAD